MALKQTYLPEWGSLPREFIYEKLHFCPLVNAHFMANVYQQLFQMFVNAAIWIWHVLTQSAKMPKAYDKLSFVYLKIFDIPC